MKKVFLALLTSVLLLSACGGNDHSGIRATGVLTVNGSGWNGSVLVGAQRIYAFSNIVANNRYTVRTMISPGGTLEGKIYASEADYKNNAAPIASLLADTVSTHVYEVFFQAPSTGTYYIAMSGTPNSTNDSQFFYDLRIMSADALTSFATTTVPASNTEFIQAGYVKIYSGVTVTPAGTYTVSVTSKSTTTIGNPQIFIYNDEKLTIPSLLYSAISSTMDYTVNTIVSGVSTSVSSQTNSIPNVPFTSAGPFILLKGNSAIDYTITVGP
ncbi:MAG: hypothetical protein OEW15_12700 [Nitrospirota bacterium]|nr:hypothetical protein [Nitrospirota bacterium]